MALPDTINTLLTAAGPLTGGLSSLGGAMDLGGMFGGEDDAQAAKSEATGTFNAGSLNVTKTDPTLIIGLLVGAVVLYLVLRKKR